MSLLRVAGLRKKYKSRTVVHDVGFEVGSGEVVGLLGPNGAGKTTCFYMIVGLVTADGGEINLDGKAITHAPIHARARLGLSYLPQEMSVFRKLTVSENIQAVLELQRMPRDQIEARLEELLEELGIAHLRDSAALALSGGERRRCEIARALATAPQLILLDEPFAAVDEATVDALMALVQVWHAQGRTVLAVLHDLALVRRAFPQTLLLAREAVACGPTATVLTPTNLARTRGMVEAFDDHAAACDAPEATTEPPVHATAHRHGHDHGHDHGH